MSVRRIRYLFECRSPSRAHALVLDYSDVRQTLTQSESEERNKAATRDQRRRSYASHAPGQRNPASFFQVNPLMPDEDIASMQPVGCTLQRPAVLYRDEKDSLAALRTELDIPSARKLSITPNTRVRTELTEPDI